MAIVDTITPGALHTTPSQFSLRAFEELLMRMNYTAELYDDLRRISFRDERKFDEQHERAANSWVATETAVFQFLRSHHRKTAVPLMVETVRAIVDLLDLETGEHPSLTETMEAAVARRSQATAYSTERALLDRAMTEIFAIAKIQADMFKRVDLKTAA